MNSYVLTFGQSLADAIDHDNSPVYQVGNSTHYAKSVPFDPETLTDEGRKLIEFMGERRRFPRRIPAPTDPKMIRAYGSEDQWTFGDTPHANDPEDLIDCTNWINKIAADCGYFDQNGTSTK